MLRTSLAVCAWLGVLGVLTVFTLGELGERDWRLELLSHLRLPITFALGVCLVMFVIARARIGSVVGAVLLLLGVASIARWYLPASGVPGEGDRVRIAVANVLASNADYVRTLDALAALEPDFAVLIEVTAAWLEAVRADPRWRIEFEEVRRFSGWIIVIAPVDSPVRLDIARSVVLTPGTSNIPAIDMRLSLDGRALRVLGVHARSPVSLGNAWDRNAQLRAVADWTDAQHEPCVVIGDLNTTVWSPYYRTLIDDTGLRNSMQGHGAGGTWPGLLPQPFRIGIDHALHSDELVTVTRTIGDPGGSDHAPVLVEFAWNAEATEASDPP